MSLVEERYEKWVHHPNLDPRYKDVLANMSEEEKNDEIGRASCRERV